MAKKHNDLYMKALACIEELRESVKEQPSCRNVVLERLKFVEHRLKHVIRKVERNE